MRLAEKAKVLSPGASVDGLGDQDKGLFKDLEPRPRYRVALFDLDGVILTPEEFYYEVHAKAHNINPDEFQVFFNSSGFGDALKDKADLKDHISRHPQLWGNRSADEILQEWLVVECAVDYEVIENALALKKKGMKVCAATNQFRQKLDYITTTVLPGVFDEVFSSSNIGHIKPEPEFFLEIKRRLRQMEGLEDLQDKEIIFFDDKHDYVESAKSVGIQGVLYQQAYQVNEIALGLFAPAPLAAA